MARNVHEELLKLAAFEGKELEAIMPDWIMAAERMGLSDADIAYSVDHWIPEHWDMNYLGVRKMMGAYLREAIEIAKTPYYKENGVKLIYGILPALTTSYTAIKQAGGDKVFISFPDMTLVTLLNSYFHKADTYFYKAEADGFTYGCRHCPLNKMRLGAYSSGLIAAPDVIWSWGFNCDEGPKTDEMIKHLINADWNYIVSRIPHDTHMGDIDDEIPERVEYIAKQLREGVDEIAKIIGITVSEEDIAAAVNANNKYAFKVGQLVSLVCSGDPQPLSGSALSNFQNPIAVPFSTGFKYMEEAIDVMIKEVRQAIKEGKGILPKGAPRVGSYYVPFCVPWVDKIFRENGVGLTFSLVLTGCKKQLKPSQYEDAYLVAAEQWLKMPLGQNLGYELESIIEKVETNNPDAMLMGFFDFDRWLGAHQKMAAKLVEERTGVPHFYMESDFWDDRDYSPEALRTRIESICQVVKLRKEMNS